MTETEIAEQVISVLQNRRGFDHFWERIDDDIQSDIIDEINAEVDAVPNEDLEELADSWEERSQMCEFSIAAKELCQMTEEYE